MRWSARLLTTLVGFSSWSAGAADAPPLVLEASIPLEQTGGRIDHMAIDLRRQRLYVAELGNGTVDGVDLAASKVIGRIRGLKEPQGVGYSEKADLLVVASAGDGSVRFYRGEDLAPAGVLQLGNDADNVRIDPRTGNVVVGYGSGSLAVIDPLTRAKIAEAPLPGHPEGFQLDPATRRAFVNVPDAHQITVVDLVGGRASGTWQVPGARSNFPMAYAPAQHLVASVFRSPPELVLFDAATGAVTARLPACGDADDVFFDDRRQRIYVSCGSGEVDTWRRDGTAYRPMPPTRTEGGARTSLFVPELDRLFVAQRAGLLGSKGAIQVFRPQDDRTN
ncbi:MAG: hypothetical protein NVS2B11_00470 [Acetobacteraceae bacterium]